MKISELTTKSFLGGAGAAANSYVLINYEDNSTSEPVTYKTSLQELGKAIANDLKLPSVTVSEGAITNFKVKGVSNGAYTETVVDAPSGDGGGNSVFESVMMPPETLMGQSISTYIVTTDQNKFYISNGSDTTPVFTTCRQPVIVYDSTSDGPFGYYEGDSSEINHISVPSMGDVNDAVDTAISGLASTGYVTNAIANAGSGFNPAEPISCSFIPYGSDSSEPLAGNLDLLMADEDAIYKSLNGVINPIIPWNKILFYEIEESEGSPIALLLKDINNTTIHTIQLN